MVAGGIDTFYGDAKLTNGGGQHDGHWSGRQGAPVDKDGLGQGPLPRYEYLPAQSFVGDPPATGAEFRRAQSGRHGDYGYLLVGQVRHDDVIRRLEPHLVVKQVSAFGQHHGNALAGVAGAAAAHRDQNVGFQSSGHGHGLV